jgi:Uma2 family endonuclease
MVRPEEVQAVSTVVENQPLTGAEPIVPRVPRGFELIAGKLVEKIVNVESSWIGGQIFFLIAAYTKATGVGWTFPPETGCQCFEGSPLMIRKPDTLFVKAGRMGWDQVGDGWLRIVPDLIVEVISPNDTAYEVDGKVELFLKAGVPLIWVVSPAVRTIRIIRGDGSTAILRDGEELSGEDIIPGFVCPVSSIFPPIKATPAEAEPVA